jgi:hypothetical protein
MLPGNRPALPVQGRNSLCTYLSGYAAECVVRSNRYR